MFHRGRVGKKEGTLKGKKTAMARICLLFTIQSNLQRPPLVSDHLSSVTSFPKYQKFASQMTKATATTFIAKS